MTKWSSNEIDLLSNVFCDSNKLSKTKSIGVCRKENIMIHTFEDIEELSQEAAKHFIEAADIAIRERGRFSVALSGGNTPRTLFVLLAHAPFRSQVDWQNVHIFWSDERCVSPDDPRSNYHMAQETLLAKIPTPIENIHHIQGELKPEAAAAKYEAELQAFFGAEPPAFDLILLGLGDNAHTASLFPHTSALNETKRWVTSVYVEEISMSRITMTAPLINQARKIIFLVSGEDKAPAVKQVLEGSYKPHEYPAQLISPDQARPIWLLDHAAAHKLRAETVKIT